MPKDGATLRSELNSWHCGKIWLSMERSTTLFCKTAAAAEKLVGGTKVWKKARKGGKKNFFSDVGHLMALGNFCHALLRDKKRERLRGWEIQETRRDSRAPGISKDFQEFWRDLSRPAVQILGIFIESYWFPLIPIDFHWFYKDPLMCDRPI